MYAFNGVRFVRLRSIVRADMYVAADVDGEGVCLTRQRAVHNTVWAVDHAYSPDGVCVLLRGAYGRYLSSGGSLVTTGRSEQTSLGSIDPPPPAARWVSISRGVGAFALRCSLGHYLRANGRLLGWRRDVTVALDNGSTMLLWAIEGVPVRVPRPNAIAMEDIYQLTHRHRPPPTESQVTRDIWYVRCDPDGHIDNAAWSMIQVRTNSNPALWSTLGPFFGFFRLGRMTITLCTRGGPYGRFTPLMIDLPIGNEPIEILIIDHGTPAHQALNYPDVNAPPLLRF